MKLPPEVRLVAHRGASAYAPESTRAAFLKARDLGAPDVETDLRMTLDGRIVLCHDENLLRYGHGPLQAEKLHSAELKELDAGSWFSAEFASERFYFLDELISDFGTSLGFDLELKGLSPELPAQALAAAERVIDQTTFISFSIDQLARAREASQKAILGYILESYDTTNFDRCAKLGIQELCLCVTELDERVARDILRQFQRLRVWGFPRERTVALALVEKALDCGCRGITVDNPDWFER